MSVQAGIRPSMALFALHRLAEEPRIAAEEDRRYSHLYAVPQGLEKTVPGCSQCAASIRAEKRLGLSCQREAAELRRGSRKAPRVCGRASAFSGCGVERLSPLRACRLPCFSAPPDQKKATKTSLCSRFYALKRNDALLPPRVIQTTYNPQAS